MNIISVDLPWKLDKKGRRALAIVDADGNVKMRRAGNDDELIELIRDNTELQSLILLDVPIDGCDNLDSEHFRPVDKALAHFVPILPTSKAKDRGKLLKGRIQITNQGKRAKVQEIYPYVVYKFLAYLLRDRKLLQRLAHDKFDTLLDDGFRAYRPPKYKREREREKLLKNMRYLYSLLMDTSAGLNFPIPLHRPDASDNLGQLSDEYDACLGAIVGIYFAHKSSYAYIAGDSKSGNMLILADRWLREQIEQSLINSAEGV